MILGTTSVPACDRLGAALRLTTNYIYRGYSKSNGEPTIQANIDCEYPSGIFGGAWLSMVRFSHHGASERPQLEFNPYLGSTFALAKDWRLDAALAGYIYDGDVFDEDYNYAEIYGQVHYRDLFTLRLGTAPNAYDDNETGIDVETLLHWALSDTIELSGGLGYDTVTVLADRSVLYWNLGVTWFPFKHVSFDIRYQDRESFIETEGGATTAVLDRFPRGVPIVFSVSIGY